MAFISFSEISHSFDGKEVFQNFNLDIDRGKKVQLSSPSGSGKTTLLKMLLGLVSPREGKVLVEETEISEGTIADIRGRISYLSQDIDFREGTTEDVVMEILNFHHNKELGVSLDTVKREAEALEIAPVSWQRSTARLSGGERQRLGLALVLSLKREIILLDEPTSALDAKMKKKVKERVLDTDSTCLLVSHDPVWKDSSIQSVSW